MFKTFRHMWQLLKAGRVMARYDGLISAEQLAEVPVPARVALRVAKLFAGKSRTDVANPLAAALEELGPSYIKLGQFLATRPDLVGLENARALLELQDKLKPFAQEDAKAEIRNGLKMPVEDAFTSFGPAIAAASIAQVHKAATDDPPRDVAVKVLRPGVEQRFRKDLESFFFAARTLERWHPPTRRLRPVAAVETLDQSARLEMDLRLEAAAISEMAANTADDADFRVPEVDWQRTSRRVLTTSWIDGTPLSDIETLKARGLDLNALGDCVIQSFLRHAIRDGFFHADMHQGNLFIDDDGKLAAVDFGITGRLNMKERRFLAEILYGFITRDYMRVSEVHFEAGYVPDSQDVAVFAQALRSIGEPLMDQKAEDISIATLLTQLFQITEQFNMHTQPRLLFLQKTMVVVEGVARTLNPKLNMWVTAEPVVKQWIEQRLGPQGRIEDAAEGAATLGKLAAAFPEVLAEAQRTAHLMAMTSSAQQQTAGNGSAGLSGSTRFAIWLGAISLAALAVAQIF